MAQTFVRHGLQPKTMPKKTQATKVKWPRKMRAQHGCFRASPLIT